MLGTSGVNSQEDELELSQTQSKCFLRTANVSLRAAVEILLILGWGERRRLKCQQQQSHHTEPSRSSAGTELLPPLAPRSEGDTHVSSALLHCLLSPAELPELQFLQGRQNTAGLVGAANCRICFPSPHQLAHITFSGSCASYFQSP